MSERHSVAIAENVDRAWAIWFTRLVLGLIFFMAGVMKVFQLGPLNHRKYFLPFVDTFLPAWSLWAMGLVIPFVELLAGALLILGGVFAKRWLHLGLFWQWSLSAIYFMSHSMSFTLT